MKNKIIKYIFLLAIFIGILSPTLFTDGMFMDGTIYAAISQNLADGNGSFWNLHFTKTLFPIFNEHPPLALYLTSLSFTIFGDSIISERIYSFLTGIFAIILIMLIRDSFSKTKSNILIISAPIIFLSFPHVPWTYSNNMLENTMTIFILISAFFSLRSLKKDRILMLFLSGIFLFAGFLSKGFTSLFVWSIIFFYWLVYRKVSFSRTVIDTLLLVFFTLLPLIIIYFFSESGTDSLLRYFNKQLIGSLQNVRTVDSRFFIIGSLLKEILIPIIILVILIIIAKIKNIKINYNKNNLKNSLFFLLIALSGIIPIMISLKQRNFYLIPALPFMAISIAYFIENILETFPDIIKFFNKRFFIPLSYVLLGISIVMIFLFYGKLGRDKDTLYDVYLIKHEIQEYETVTICKEMYNNWSLHAYLQRYGRISITDKTNNRYFLSINNCYKDTLYQKVNLKLNKFTLYKIKN